MCAQIDTRYYTWNSCTWWARTVTSNHHCWLFLPRSVYLIPPIDYSSPCEHPSYTPWDCLLIVRCWYVLGVYISSRLPPTPWFYVSMSGTIWSGESKLKFSNFPPWTYDMHTDKTGRCSTFWTCFSMHMDPLLAWEHNQMVLSPDWDEVWGMCQYTQCHAD